jgi:hypothetical protein
VPRGVFSNASRQMQAFDVQDVLVIIDSDMIVTDDLGPVLALVAEGKISGPCRPRAPRPTAARPVRSGGRVSEGPRRVLSCALARDSGAPTGRKGGAIARSLSLSRLRDPEDVLEQGRRHASGVCRPEATDLRQHECQEDPPPALQQEVSVLLPRGNPYAKNGTRVKASRQCPPRPYG